MTPLGVEYGCKYTLTGPDGAIAVFNDSTSPNFVGILSPESSGLDSPDVREDAQDSAEEDGGIHGDFFYGRRPVILQGTIIASSATDRNAKVTKLQEASNAMRGDATLKWKPAGASAEVELKLRRQQPLRITKGYVKDFQLAMVSANAYILSATTNEKTMAVKETAWTTAKTGATGVNAGGVSSWTNAAKITAVDGLYAELGATLSSESKWLEGTNFGFVLPSGANILGVQSKLLETWREGAGTIKGYAKLLLGGAVAGTEVGPTSALVGTPLEYALPGIAFSRSLWGNTISKAQAENSGFGVAVKMKESAGVSTKAFVDALQMKLFYTESFKVTNSGNASAFPIFTFSALHESGFVEIENQTTGQKLKITANVLGGETITVNTKNRTVVKTVGGVSTNIYSSLDFSASSWIELLPGENTLLCGTGTVKVEWQDAWV